MSIMRDYANHQAELVIYMSEAEAWWTAAALISIGLIFGMALGIAAMVNL